MSKRSQTYPDKLDIVCNFLRKKNGSFSAPEVHQELIARGWASPLDTVLDIYAQLKEHFGPPDGKV